MTTSPQLSATHRRNATWTALLGGLVLAAGMLAQSAHAAEVSVTIGVDESLAEQVRAWRRSAGLDAADPAADARYAQRLQNAGSVRAQNAQARAAMYAAERPVAPLATMVTQTRP